MSVCKRKATGIIVVSSRLIHPTGKWTWICAKPAVIDGPWIFIQHDPAIGSSHYGKITLFPEYSVILIKRGCACHDFIYYWTHVSIHGYAADSWHIRGSLRSCSSKIYRPRVGGTLEERNIRRVRKYQSQF